MKDEPRIYVPKCSAKAIEIRDFTILKLSFNASVLAEFARNNQNEAGYLNLCITPRREKGQYGDTHSVTLDTFKPDPNKRRSQASSPVSDVPNPGEQDVPF